MLTIDINGAPIHGYDFAAATKMYPNNAGRAMMFVAAIAAQRSGYDYNPGVDPVMVCGVAMDEHDFEWAMTGLSADGIIEKLRALVNVRKGFM